MIEVVASLFSAALNAFKLKEHIARLLGRAWRRERTGYGARVADLRGQVADALNWQSQWTDRPYEYSDGMSARLFADTFGFKDLDAVSEIEAGRRPPSRDDLDRFAEQTGASRRHLVDGSEPIWAPLVAEADDPLDALEFIDDDVRTVTAVRVDAPDGEVALIVDRGDWRTARVVRLRGFHFGSRVGGGGRARQESLFWLRAVLDPEMLVPEVCATRVEAIRCKVGLADQRVDLWGRVTDRQTFEALVLGALHPFTFLDRAGLRDDHWFFDFVDLLHTCMAAPGYDQKFGEQFAIVQRNVRQSLGLKDPPSELGPQQRPAAA